MSEEVLKTPVIKTSEKKPKKEKSKARKIVEWILFAIFGAIFAFILIGNIQGAVNKKDNYNQSIRFGVGSFIVLTNSMEPEIKQDDAIITYKEDVSTFKDRLAKGETIDVTFANVPIEYSLEPDTERFKHANGGRLVISGQIMTHRLIEVHEDASIEYGKGRYIFVASGINYETGEYSKAGQYQLFTEKQYLGVVQFSNGALGKVFNFIISPIGLILLLLIPAVYLIVTSSIDIFKAMKESEASEGVYTGEGDKLATLTDADRERLKKELLEEMINAKREEKKNDQ